MASKMPNGDVWKLKDKDVNSQNYGIEYKFDFSYLKNTKFINIVSNYVWRNYIEENKSLATIYNFNKQFRYFNLFALSGNIRELKYLNNNDVDKYISFLKTTLSPYTKKPLVYKYQKNCLDALKSIIRWGQLNMPNDVPKGEIFVGNEYIGTNRKLKIDYIPDEVVLQINKALINEKNIYVKYGLIILQSTGMRIGDMLKLTTDSVKPHLISGYILTWYDHKNRKERQPMPIPNECAIAVEKLIEYTKEIRQNADNKIKKYLFIHKVRQGGPKIKTGEIINTSNSSMTNWVNDFIESNNIKDTNGELYNLKFHQFRRTLATDMFSKGINLEVIQEVLGHSSPATTTKHYADVKDKERAEIFKHIGIIGNINKVDETVIIDKKDLIWFKENKDKGARMEDGYCTKPCADGKICDRLLKRQKCYTCSRYITTPEYLQAHKNHLAELEKQLEGNIYGDHYSEHFLPTIEILKEIVKRLEEIQAYYEVETTSNK